MAKFVGADLNFGGVSRILDLQDGIDPQEPATVAQLNAQASGLAWKDNARVSTQGNINLASPGSSIDGVTWAEGDRVLVRAQTDAEFNGIYLFAGAATPMTRAPDAATFESLHSAVVTIDQGTDAGATFRQTALNGTIDTDDVLWTSFGTAAPNATESARGIIEIATQAEMNTGTDDERAVTPLKARNATWLPKGHAETIGDNSNTEFTVTHNLGTRDVIVQVYANGGDYDEVIAEVERTSTSAVTVIFSSPPTVNEYRVVVLTIGV